MRAVSVVAAGSVFLGGDFSALNTVSRINIAAIDQATGTVIAGFNPAGGADSTVRALSFTAGNVYLGGDFANVAGSARARVAEGGEDAGAGVVGLHAAREVERGWLYLSRGGAGWPGRQHRHHHGGIEDR